jgi:hypothetical protein
MPGGFEDRMQPAQLLQEMDNAPRCSGCARVPNPKYFNADNAALPSEEPSSVNVMDVATAPAASAASGTSMASLSSPLQPATIAPIARKAGTVAAALLVHSATTNEVRQLLPAELLAAAASAASEASGTPLTSQTSLLQTAGKAPIARKVDTVTVALLAHSATTDEVRQLLLTELLAAAASAAVSRDPATYKGALRGTDAEKWAEACHYEMDALWK